MRVMRCTLVLLATETITVNYTWTVFMLGKSKVSGMGGGGGCCEDITWFGLLVHTMSTNTRYQTVLPLLSWSVVTKCLATEAKVNR